MIDIASYSAMFYAAPEGVEWEGLEFILHAAEERNGKEYSHYAEKLHDMLDAALLLDPRNKENDLWARVTDRTGYGTEAFTVTVDKLEDLAPALAICAEVVKVWANVYRVREMKR